MAKLNNPLHSLSAAGGLGKTLVFRRQGSHTIAQGKAQPPDVKSLAQLSWRTMYQKAVILWHALSAAEKAAWESDATPRHMTGFAWFMSQALKPNPGIYLPLAGGTMQGAVDMGGNQLSNISSLSLSNLSFCSVYRGTSNQAIPTGVMTLVEFNAEVSDLQGEWDSTVNYRYDSKYTGLRLIVGVLYLDDLNDGDRCSIQVRKNGNPIWQSGFNMGAAGRPRATISTMTDVVPTDTINVYLFHTFGANRDLFLGTGNSNLSVFALTQS